MHFVCLIIMALAVLGTTTLQTVDAVRSVFCPPKTPKCINGQGIGFKMCKKENGNIRNECVTSRSKHTRIKTRGGSCGPCPDEITSNGDPNGGGGGGKDKCLTESTCNSRQKELDITDKYYYVGNYRDYGCFQKNGKVYWGRGGSVLQMVIDPLTLSGKKERIFV